MVIGASRGIGLGLAQRYAEDGWQVHATTRSPGRSEEHSLNSSHW